MHEHAVARVRDDGALEGHVAPARLERRAVAVREDAAAERDRARGLGDGRAARHQEAVERHARAGDLERPHLRVGVAVDDDAELAVRAAALRRGLVVFARREDDQSARRRRLGRGAGRAEGPEVLGHAQRRRVGPREGRELVAERRRGPSRGGVAARVDDGLRVRERVLDLASRLERAAPPEPRLRVARVEGERVSGEARRVPVAAEAQARLGAVRVERREQARRVAVRVEQLRGLAPALQRDVVRPGAEGVVARGLARRRARHGVQVVVAAEPADVGRAQPVAERAERAPLPRVLAAVVAVPKAVAEPDAGRRAQARARALEAPREGPDDGRRRLDRPRRPLVARVARDQELARGLGARQERAVVAVGEVAGLRRRVEHLDDGAISAAAAAAELDREAAADGAAVERLLDDDEPREVRRAPRGRRAGEEQGV